MQINLPPEIERDILHSAETGDLASAAQQLAAAIMAERPALKASPREQNVDELRENVLRKQSWREFRTSRPLAEIAAEQGVGPVTDPNDLIFPGWPEDESVDDFIAAAKGHHFKRVMESIDAEHEIERDQNTPE